MSDDKVRVWIEADRERQHFCAPPESTTARDWQGVTDCGVAATLHWVHYEHVDAGKTCQTCVTTAGQHPPLEGDHPGPV